MPRFPSRSIFMHTGLELTKEQQDALATLEADIPQPIAREIIGGSQPAATSGEQRKRHLEYRMLVLKRDRAIAENLKQLLLPQQYNALLAYTRLHTLFSVGPHGIYQERKRNGLEEWRTRREFDETLQRSVNNLHDHIKKVRIAAVSFAATHPFIKVESRINVVDLEVLDEADGQYEMLFRGLYSFDQER